MKWLFSRMWDNTPGDLWFKATGRLPWNWVMNAEEWLAMRFPDSWFDQNDSCEPQDLEWHSKVSDWKKGDLAGDCYCPDCAPNFHA